MTPTQQSSSSSQIVLNGIYRLDELIGKGTWGEVRRALNLETNQEVAVKIVDLRKIMEPKECSRQRLTLQREIAILKFLNHPNIVKLYDAFEKEDKFYLIMEYVSGGELFHYVLKKKVLPEEEARKLLRQIISAIEYCHSCLVIHRDLKLENVLLDSQGNIKITDFGFSNFIEPGKLFQTFCGSPMYSPPEIFSGQRYLGPPADVWSLGVILFAMVSGYLPFSDVNDNIRVLRKRVCMGDYKVPVHLSPDCRNLIKKMMKVRQEQRLSVQAIRRHPWVNKGYMTKPDSFLPSFPKVTTLQPEILDQLVALGFDRNDCVKQMHANKPRNQIVATYNHILQLKNVGCMDDGVGISLADEVGSPVHSHTNSMSSRSTPGTPTPPTTPGGASSHGIELSNHSPCHFATTSPGTASPVASPSPVATANPVSPVPPKPTAKTAMWERWKQVFDL